MYCRHCKTAIPEGAAFCIECGEPVDEEEQAVEEASQQAAEEASQQSTEEHPDQATEKDILQQADSDEEPPSLQPTKSFDSLEEKEDVTEEDKTPEELALEHLFTDDEGTEKDADRADITRQIEPVDAQSDMPEEKDAEQLLISVDSQKKNSRKKNSGKKSSPDLTRQMDPDEVEKCAQPNDQNTQGAKPLTGIEGNPRQTQQQVVDEGQKADLIRASDRHVITIIVIVIIAIFATIALTLALVYFDPFDLGNATESAGSQAEDVYESREEVSDTTDNSDVNFENDADDDIYAVGSNSIGGSGAAVNNSSNSGFDILSDSLNDCAKRTSILLKK